MIEVKNLTKKIRGNIILDNISFSVKNGEILGFLGPNGAGKTTTMKIITSFWLPTAGDVKVGNKDVVENSLITRSKIGYLPETVPLYEDMKAREYLKFAAQVRGIKNSEINQAIAEAAEACGITDVLNKPIDELSKGYRQRVGLAQAIIHKPEILILDEPTTGLDPNQIMEIRDLIKKIGKEKTVIFSTHILSEVSATCDRAIIINRGKIVGEGTPAELTKNSKGQQIIKILIRGDRDSVFKKLKNINGSQKVIITNKEKPNIYSYEIYTNPEVDMRENLAKEMVNSNFGLLEMTPKTISLEDVFKELTK